MSPQSDNSDMKAAIEFAVASGSQSEWSQRNSYHPDITISWSAYQRLKEAIAKSHKVSDDRT